MTYSLDSFFNIQGNTYFQFPAVVSYDVVGHFVVSIEFNKIMVYTYNGKEYEQVATMDQVVPNAKLIKGILPNFGVVVANDNRAAIYNFNGKLL